MNYFYDISVQESEKNLILQLENAAHKIHEKIKKIDLNSLTISDYNKKYLCNKLENFEGSLKIYTYLLYLGIKKFNSLKEIVLLDYGGGSGLMTLLAKELGVGRVIYNDIYDVSCSDIISLSNAMHIKVDDCVCGDIDDVLKYVEINEYKVDVICSYDVIEHIYDVYEYLRKIPSFKKDQNLQVILGSGANTENPMIRRQLEQAHLNAENMNKSYEIGHKTRDSLGSYLDLRKEIVKENSLGLSIEEIDNLAKSTRGLMEKDIKSIVAEYMQYKTISYKPDHPTNTCDPLTGNWQEHLMDIALLKKIMLEKAHSVDVLSGYWTFTKNKINNLIKLILNFIVKHGGKLSLKAAPFYILCAEY